MNPDENNARPAAEAPSPTVADAAPSAEPPRTCDVPLDLQVPWDWVDLLLLVAIAVGGILVSSMILVSVFGAFGIGPSRIQHTREDAALFAICTQVLLYAILLGYLAAQMRIRSSSPFWRAIGWRALQAVSVPRPLVWLGYIAGGFLLQIFVTLASSAFPPRRALPIQMVFEGRTTAMFFMAVAVLLAPLVEETIFRGYIYPVVARTYGVLASVLFTGAVFGLLHGSQLGFAWLQVALLIVVGIILTWARAATRTVTSSYLLHVSYNSFQVIWFLVASHGLSVLPLAR
ncbi:MAG TPA: CPBP family intramembrane glutamic endopeptidase [Candidatus Acidoferrales bacterium]|nr:CPBP family intramembrane glutamic endopeptidase [Candidatus Acidoferrales bacterium]